MGQRLSGSAPQYKCGPLLRQGKLCDHKIHTADPMPETLPFFFCDTEQFLIRAGVPSSFAFLPLFYLPEELIPQVSFDMFYPFQRFCFQELHTHTHTKMFFWEKTVKVCVKSPPSITLLRLPQPEVYQEYGGKTNI